MTRQGLIYTNSALLASISRWGDRWGERKGERRGRRVRESILLNGWNIKINPGIQTLN
jgi:hypothetical protein